MLSKESGPIGNFDYCFVGSGAILDEILKIQRFSDSEILIISNHFIGNKTLVFKGGRARVISRTDFLNFGTGYKIRDLIILTKSHRWDDAQEFFKVMHLLGDLVTNTVVHISSSSVYGNESVRGNEATPTVPISEYGRSKVLEEEIVVSQFKSSKKIVVLRVSNVYGNLSFNDFVNKCIGAAEQGLSIEIFMHGSMVRDFLFVDCLVDAVDKLLSVDLPDRRTYFNVGTGDATSIMDLIRKIEFLVGSSVLWSEAAPTEGIIKYSVLDSSELMSAIKWEPLGLEVGLMRYLERDFPRLTKVK